MMSDIQRNQNRRLDHEGINAVVARILRKLSLFQKFKYIIVFSLCFWIVAACNFFIYNQVSKTDAIAWDSSKNILFEKQNAEVLSEKLKNSIFINHDEWNNVSKNLQDIWSRLVEMEGKIGNIETVLKQKTSTTMATLTSKHIKDELCNLTAEEMTEFPACNEKINWMKNFWGSDPCYKTYGVDGGFCSIRFYLSEVENWCPAVSPSIASELKLMKPQPPPPIRTTWNKNLSGLMKIMMEPPPRKNYEWILNRIVRLWHLWLAAVKEVESETQKPRTQKKILIYLGFLSKKSGFRFQQTVSAGGPLGEMVQWSDILSALYILGHQMTVTSEYEELTSVLSSLPDIKSQCQTRENLPFDMVVTDIVGLTHFKRHVKQGYGKFSCLLRIIDTFGTEASYNSLQYVKNHKELKTPWGVQELNLKQFYTMFPHSPDNSFMGFVVEQFLNSSELKLVKKKNQAVVYGKSKSMWIGKENYLKVISEHLEVHGTVYTQVQEDPGLPSFVRNHGILSGADLQRLLLESKLFIGLGFPYEGPAPLEAIAAGCVFINPKFTPPHSSRNTKFFRSKPTARQLTSQHPYAEDFISEPHVFTIDISNEREVEDTVVKALAMVDDEKVRPYLPFEYTHRGMLERLNAYLEHQDFCSKDAKLWPPAESVSAVLSEPGQSCKDVCWSRKLICEPTHFKRLNGREAIESATGRRCARLSSAGELHRPAYDGRTGDCHLQADDMLYSCVDAGADHLVRICPCRTFVRGQTALCPGCF